MKIFITSLLVLSFSVAFAPTNLVAQKTMELEDAIQYALDNNYTIQNARLTLADARQRMIETRAIGLPQVTGSVSFKRYLEVPKSLLPAFFFPPGTPEESRRISFLQKNNFTASATLNTMLFNGNFFVALEAAKAYKDYAAIEYLTKEKEVKNQVTDAFLPVLLLQENITIFEKNIANLMKVLHETRELYKAGFAEQLDVDRLELSLSNLKVERDNLIKNKENVLAVLKFSMNYPATEPLDVEGNLESLLLLYDSKLANAKLDFANRPDVSLVNEGIHLSALNIKNYKAEYLPSLYGFIAGQYDYQGNNKEDGFWAPTALVGVQLNVPIFDGFGRGAKVQRAKIELEKAQNQQAQMLQGIEMEVNNAKNALQGAKERLDERKKNLALAQRIYETTQVKYREGVGSSLEVSQAEQALYNSQAKLVQAKYDLLSAKVSLAKALGL